MTAFVYRIRVARVVGGLALMAAALSGGWPARAADPAHVIAQKFAEEHAAAERRQAAAARRKAEAEAAARRRADEREMLEQAKAEAAERAMRAAAREAEAKAEAIRQAAIAEDLRRHRAEQEATQLRAEAEARRSAEAEAEAEAARVKEAEARAAAERSRVAAEAAKAAEAELARTAEAQQRRLEAERDAEIERVTARLRASERRTSVSRERPTIAPKSLTEDDEARDAEPAVVARHQQASEPALERPEPLGARATILLIIKPGDRGIRRLGKSADPVICFESHCYIGAGADTPALQLTRGRAFGTVNTLGGRAGACAGRIACVFRDVDLGAASNVVQPVDLRIMRHDRREVREIDADASCGVVSGRLVCGKPVVSDTWRMWVVPQSVADAAGPQLLEAALAGGLDMERVAGR